MLENMCNAAVIYYFFTCQLNIHNVHKSVDETTENREPLFLYLVFVHHRLKYLEVGNIFMTLWFKDDTEMLAFRSYLDVIYRGVMWPK
jgi:hypothetical protein